MRDKYFNYNDDRLRRLSVKEKKEFLDDVNRAHIKAGNPPLRDKVIGYDERNRVLVTKIREDNNLRRNNNLLSGFSLKDLGF